MMEYYNRPTEQEKAELERLNKNVEAAIDERTKFLDDLTLRLASVKPGEELYNLNTGARLGVVEEIKRYHSGYLLDDSYEFYYTFCTNPESSEGARSIDNTSRQCLRVGTKEQYEKEQIANARAILKRFGTKEKA